MDKAVLAADLAEILTGPISVDAPMAELTTWKIGGPADLLVCPGKEEELEALLPYLQTHAVPWMVVGNGSNLLVGDKGFRGVVIKMGEPFAACQWRGLDVTAGAGMLLGALALEAAERSAKGFEFARGIPGSVGGAVRMNAGAYGSFIGEFVTQVEAIDFEGKKVVLGGDQIEFAYRDSSLFRLDAVITAVSFKLEQGERESIMAQIKDYQQRRTLAQPLEYPSCGSVFRNPANDNAGRLVELAGLRGQQIGAAAVSQKHGNFIINLGGATAAEVRELILQVQQQVYDFTGVRLELEVKMIGEF